MIQKESLEAIRRIREIIYTLFPQTNIFSVDYIENKGKVISGEFTVRLLNNSVKKVKIFYDYLNDKLEIREEKE